MADILDKTLFKPPELGCVLYLPGLPGGGNKMYDRSPYGNIGTITGATWTRLPSGLWCLSFDGTDDIVNCGTNNSLQPTTQLSLEAWYKATASDTNVIIRQDDTNGTKKGYHLFIWSTDIAYFDLGDGTNRRRRTATMPADYVGKWYHLAAVWDGANMNIYFNGVVQGSPVAKSTAIVYTSTNPTYIGADNGTLWGNGAIALPRIYNRALSNLEIQNHFNREKRLLEVL